MKIRFIVKEGSGTCWHRMYTPLDNMEYEGFIDMGLYGVDEDPKDCDIYMFNRDVSMSPEKLLALKREKGFKIVVDIDDYWILPPSHILYKDWTQGTYVKHMLEFVKIADLVTTTHARLASHLMKYNSNIFVYPNTITPREVSKPQKKMTFGWVGGITHFPDLRLLEPTFRRIGQEPFIKNNAVFNLCGYQDNPLWAKMAKIFRYTTSFNIYGSLPLTEYMNHYDGIDVVLVPLVSNEFNACKSVLKIIEAAASHKTVIVSDVAPYNTLKHVPGIMWVKKNSDWIEHIRFCIKNPDKVKEMAGDMSTTMLRIYDAKYWAQELYKQLQLCVS